MAENKLPLQVWFDDHDWVVAETAADATDIMHEVYGNDSSAQPEDFSQLSSDESISIFDGETEETVKHTAAEWIASNGRGLLASVDF